MVSPAVTTLPANLSPCFNFLSLIPSIGADTYGGLKRKDSINMPVLAMVFLVSIAIADPSEWPANQILEAPTVATKFQTSWIAISTREV